MPYHSHKLNSTHSHIIGRTDPITGDSVKENDKVVFCAACQSCFLEESWVYMNESHCEQNQTLSSVPALPSPLIVKKRKEQFLGELRNNSSSGILTLLTFIVVSISMGILLNKITSLGAQIAMVFGFIVGSLASVALSTLTSSRKFKRMTKQDKKDVRLFYTHIEIGKDSFSWNDISQIKYQRVTSSQNYARLSSLLLYFKSGHFLTKDLPFKDDAEIRRFLLGLEKTSHFVEVCFYSEKVSEYQFMMSIEENSTGNIQVGEPKQLFY